MKKTVIAVLLLFLLVACADDQFRPSWTPAYADTIVDSDGLLTGLWDPQIKEYDLYTNNDTLGITVTTPTRMSIAIGGVSVSGVTSSSNQVALVEGLNEINVVLNGSGLVPLTYRLKVLRVSPDKETRLSALSVSGGTLTPGFNPSVYDYFMNVASSSVDFTVTARSATASVLVNGTPVTQGVPFTVSGLTNGATNTIPVRVISTDGTVTNDTLVKIVYLDVITIAQARADGLGTYPTPKYIEGIVVKSGGSSLNAYIQEVGVNSGITLRSLGGSFLFVTGDHVRVKFTTRADYNGLMQISVANPADVTILASGRADDLAYDTVTATPALADEGKYVRVLNYTFLAPFTAGNLDASPFYFRNETGATIAAGTYSEVFGSAGRYNTTAQIMIYDQNVQVVP